MLGVVVVECGPGLAWLVAAPQAAHEVSDLAFDNGTVGA
jgi:hypothetical protein